MKKTKKLILALVLSIVLLSVLTLHVFGISNNEKLNVFPSADSANCYIIGDVNFDGFVDSIDASLILKYDASLACNDRIGDVESFIGVTNAYVDNDLHLWVELFNGKKIDTGYIGVSSTSAEIPTIDLSKHSTDILIGDVNYDGYVDSLDAALILKYDAALTSNEFVATKLPANSIKDSYIDENYHYWLALSDGTKIDAGYVRATMYTVTFKDFDGTVLKTETVGVGESVEAPNAPERSGYRFIDWDGKAENVTSDMTITAQYVQQFTVTFKDFDGTILKTETIDSGKTPMAPTSPTRPHYTFIGWDTAFTNVTSDLTVTAQYSERTYAINYYNTKGAVISEEYTSYSEHAGLHLPRLSGVEGYTFEGWYTLAVGGDRIDDISIGSTNIYNLYARWEATKYTITYNKSAVHSNPKTYTIEDEVILEDPTWSGLKFGEWIDHSGKVEFYNNSIGDNCAKIPKGTTGDIEITATWHTLRNLIVPSKGDKLAPVYDIENGRYFFIYDLGTIQNVVLNLPADHYYKTTIGGHVLELSKQQTIDENVAKNLANTIGNSVTMDEHWLDITDWTTHWDANEYVDVSINLGGGIKDIFEASLKTDFGMTINASEDWKETHEIGGGKNFGETTSETITSMISYRTELMSSSKITEILSGDMPDGYYSYAYATDVRVFAIVTYNPDNGTYQLNTYNVLDNMHTMMLYDPSADDYVNAQPNSLSFVIPTDRIEGIIENSYFINYNGNGGAYNKNDGSDKYIHLFEVGKENVLADNNFTKTGYRFAGWEYRTESGVKTYSAGQPVKDLATQGKLITLYATWAPMEYIITFDANGGSVSTAQKSVTYDSTYGTLPTPTRTGYTFAGWTLNGNSVVSNTTVKTGGNHTITANWVANTYTVTLNLNPSMLKTTPTCSKNSETVTFDGEYTLPIPTAPYYTFTGWYTEASGGTQLTAENGKSLSKWAIASNITLYARWTQTYSDYTYVTNATDLKAIANNTAGKYMLLNDIDNIGAWTPINSFSGELNGNGKTLSDININIPANAKAQNEFYGIFKTNKGTIKNLRIANSSVYMESQHNGAGTVYAGLICGDGSGLISNVTVDNSSVQIHRSRSSYGLISGTYSGTINNCTVSNSTVYGNGDEGGISGTCSGTVSSCTAKNLYIGYYVIHNNKSIGGIVGYFSTNGKITGCSVIGTTFDFRGSSDDELDGESLHKFFWGAHDSCRFAPKVGYVVGHLQNCTESGNTASGNTKAFTGGGSYDDDDKKRLTGNYNEAQYYFANSNGKYGKLN